jgi:hypothetical protein
MQQSVGTQSNLLRRTRPKSSARQFRAPLHMLAAGRCCEPLAYLPGLAQCYHWTIICFVGRAESCTVLGRDSHCVLRAEKMKRVVLSAMERAADDKVKTLLRECTAVADCWTDSAVRPYLGVAAHFIDNEWNLRSCCLDLMRLPTSHTAANFGHCDVQRCGQVRWQTSVCLGRCRGWGPRGAKFGH